jgi:LuxR family maltose regulon positive regulatory protein
LQTKLFVPPIRPEWVSRPQLTERLNVGLNRKLTLVSAPAGFGKTTLVSEWVHGRGTDACPRRRGSAVIPPAGASTADEASVPLPVAWLSLDEGDNDQTRFLTYLVAALQAAEADIGKGILAALESPQPPPADVVLTSLINEIAAFPARMLLVLDDYHLIEAQPVHDALGFLLDHLPPAARPLGGLHLVISTREDPPLHLARLRARGQLTELRATDLRFTPTEAAEFLNRVMGLDLSAEDIAALETRTEGWIAGLQLAALALQGPSMQGREDVTGFVRSFAGSHHFVLDYLVEEVLEQQPEGVQEFLLQTAILDRLTGPLCDALQFDKGKLPSSSVGTTAVRFGETKSPTLRSSEATLEMLERANLFIVPLDEERRWYRYHRLFADLLRQRLQRERPDLVPELHQRASEWYKENGLIP